MVNGGKADQHGSGFADNEAHYRKTDGRSITFTRIIDVNQIYAADPYDLFRQLCQRGHGSFTDAIKVAVDAGMDGGHGDGKRDDAQQRRSPRFKQKFRRYGIRKQVDISGTSGRKQHGNTESGEKGAEGTSVIMCRGFVCHKFGDSGLYTGDGDGESQRQNRGGKLIQSHSFGAEHPGEENPVKKADETADKACNGQNNSACNKRIVFLHAIPVLRICL